MSSDKKRELQEQLEKQRRWVEQNEQKSESWVIERSTNELLEMGFEEILNGGMGREILETFPVEHEGSEEIGNRKERIYEAVEGGDAKSVRG